MVHQIEPPQPDDAASVGWMQLEAWLQTYPNEVVGIDEAWVREHRGSAVTAEGIARWREFIEQAVRQPELLFCRVVRSGSEVVGVLCGRRDEGVTLGPMYLLDKAQGRGIGGRLMDEFLAWAGDSRMHLWVTDYNTRAIRFYERYGFSTTGERELWRDKLPNVRMAREPILKDQII
ncbi:GNAT family N-acetyltransferase [Streptomyces sp. Isolate_45]|uniref:GNAT family N-acetyltransferase n=1 Tax=Streptomyces sp. Isolate_45 TaxID=2950111 RepID=UPI0024819E4B|nr:GNAT family N-acetyltransferase [Streptomyces sp. Isolate_45]MDA5281181.1 GNAT family N-acetyltransferase [Streptomyces sp. Isolate_45]